MTTNRKPNAQPDARCSCGAPADISDETGATYCSTHQYKAVGRKVTLYEITTDFPDVVGLVTP